MDKYKELEARKKEIEKELETQETVLLRENVNMDTPLITVDGFPRSDIDVAAIRIARSKINALKNDHRQVEQELLELLPQLFQQSQSPPQREQTKSVEPESLFSPSTQIESESTGTATVPTLGRYPTFCYVDAVSPGSPIQEAGVCLGDEIVRFGTATQMSDLSVAVQANENKPISVMLARDQGNGSHTLVTLLVTPRRWNGPGLLGCHLMPK
ncbi:26S proteasome regulator [Schizosaccharomyces japonicus yFS275]|uniref:Probable 26S proteasome regulatory subunit p27 n=1 Tax=Schizosaccharomyces japonicus (strain yFS275 / FY16936) TaxID=402676 RepID=B6K0L4_SCHJY|nr:26S proteasome regulator [Schizosaccharomyces japonicus yFS275]EEB07485.1 26S proteasome regulator [Schizosaccharomyces japonicus yFS275]